MKKEINFAKRMIGIYVKRLPIKYSGIKKSNLNRKAINNAPKTKQISTRKNTNVFLDLLYVLFISIVHLIILTQFNTSKRKFYVIFITVI